MCSPSDHIRLKRPSQFPRLPFIGVQTFPGDDRKLEMRNCPTCKSTLAVEVEENRK